MSARPFFSKQKAMIPNMKTLTGATVTKLLNNPPFRILPASKQLTLAFEGIYIASTTVSERPLLVWETEQSYPRYYIPVESLHEDLYSIVVAHTIHSGKQARVSGQTCIVETSDAFISHDGWTQAVIEHIRIGEKTMSWARFFNGPLDGYIRFEKSELDDWFENGSLFTSIKNPYKRIDTSSVSHHIIVEVDGEIVAETNSAVSLAETGLCETYYLPATSIRDWGAVSKSDLRTACPYKGEAWYLNLTVKGQKYENLMWYYPYPTHESAAVAGLVSFYRKGFVEISVDGMVI